MLLKVRDGSEEAKSQFQFEDFQKLLKQINKEIENSKKNHEEEAVEHKEEQKSDDLI